MSLTIKYLHKTEIGLGITGLISILSYFNLDNNMLYAISFSIFGFVFLIILVWVIVYQRKIGMILGLIIVSLIGLNELRKSELLKSKTILSATLKDDLSLISLALYENNTFLITSDFMLGKESYTGSYQLEGNKIIFLSQPYENDFIPDTVYIYGDKLILDFDENGDPNTRFASFFTIEKNEYPTKRD